MYCTKCGADNSGTAIYCRKCGTATEAEDETQVPRRWETGEVVMTDDEASDERQIFRISPTLLFVKAGYVLAAIGALMLVALFSAFTSVATWIAICIGFLMFLIPAYHHVKKKLVSYTLTDTKLEVDEGLVSRRTRNVPIRRIQDVTVNSTVFQRMLGLGDLVIDNASEDGEKVILKNIDSPKQHSETLLKQMRRLG